VKQDSLVEQTATLLQELELKQFAPGSYESGETLKLAHEVHNLIQQMEKVL
jgi:hypothetical protein